MAQVYSSNISAIRYEAGLRVGDNTTTMPNVHREEIASIDCDLILVQASSTEGDLCPDSEPIIIEGSPFRASALRSGRASIGRSSDRDFDHRTPEHLDGPGLSTNAEYDEVGSADINILTPDSGTDIPVAHQRLPSYHSGAKLGPGLCPHWKVHSTDGNLWKCCQMCKSHLRRMFADLVLDSW
jgi:hypothetical protein